MLFTLFFFNLFYKPDILLREKTNYTGKQASPWIIETKEGGLLNIETKLTVTPKCKNQNSIFA